MALLGLRRLLLLLPLLLPPLLLLLLLLLRALLRLLLRRPLVPWLPRLPSGGVLLLLLLPAWGRRPLLLRLPGGSSGWPLRRCQPSDKWFACLVHPVLAQPEAGLGESGCRRVRWV